MQGILRSTDYAARVLLHLASMGENSRVQVRDIADRRLMPAPYVRRVVARLAAAGIVRTVRGSGGGVRLARPAGEISLLDVVRAMEGGVALNRCVADAAACPLSETCPVQRAWCDATRRLEKQLGSVTFANLPTPPDRPTRRRKEP